jgi:hypothetical protein
MNAKTHQISQLLWKLELTPRDAVVRDNLYVVMLTYISATWRIFSWFGWEKNIILTTPVSEHFDFTFVYHKRGLEPNYYSETKSRPSSND